MGRLFNGYDGDREFALMWLFGRSLSASVLDVQGGLVRFLLHMILS